MITPRLAHRDLCRRAQHFPEFEFAVVMAIALPVSNPTSFAVKETTAADYLARASQPAARAPVERSGGVFRDERSAPVALHVKYGIRQGIPVPALNPGLSRRLSLVSLPEQPKPKQPRVQRPSWPKFPSPCLLWTRVFQERRQSLLESRLADSSA